MTGIQPANDSSTIRLAHGALILANFFFGAGAVVGALGLPTTNPLTFALVREIFAGLLLLITSHWFYRSKNKTHATNRSKIINTSLGVSKSNWKHLAGLGLAVFGNQAAFIVGVKLAGPVAASVWQPSQPIFTAAICMALGWEKLNLRRIAGVLIAFSGCIIMIILSQTKRRSEGEINREGIFRYMIGNVLFFMNCFCTSLYIILSKKVLSQYTALTVTTWSYNFAAVYMLGAILVAEIVPGAQEFLCPECENDTFHIPKEAVPALLYYIIFSSAGAYGLVTWANQFASGTLVMSYSVLQPVISIILTGTLLSFGAVKTCGNLEISGPCLDPPGVSTLCGMFGVFCGLGLIISTEPKTNARREEDESLPKFACSKCTILKSRSFKDNT